MKRGGPLRRDPEKLREWRQRSKPLRRRRKKKPYSKKKLKGRSLEVANRQAFRLAAERQCRCAKCDRAPRNNWDLQNNFDAHHVIEKRYLKSNCLPLFNTENALLLCEDCHRGQTNRLRPLPLRCLTDANISYAFYLLRSYAHSYLRMNYTGDDPRVERSLEEQERRRE